MRGAKTAALLEDGILSLFLRLAPSAILGMAISGIYSLVDGIYIGRIVGHEGFTAVTLTFPLMVLSSGIGSLIGVGSASIYSRFLGARDEDRASRVFPLLVALNVALGGIFAVAIIPFLPSLLVFLGAEGENLRLGARYGAIVLGGTVLGSLQGSTNVLIRAEGRMRSAMIVLASGAVLNIGLDAVFMLLLPWGVVGAAAATVASQGAGAAIGMWYFISGLAAVRPRLRADGINLGIARGILSVGASALALPILTLAQSSIILRSVKVYGFSADIPVVGAVTRVFQLLAIPLWGAAQAFLPVSGTNYGAGKLDRVRRSWLVFTAASTALALMLWLPAMLFPRAFLSLFLKDPALLDWGANKLRAFLLAFPALGFLLTTLTLLQSTGRGLAASLLTSGKFLVFFVPALLVLVPRVGISGVFLAAPIADAIVLVLCALLLIFDFPGKRQAVRPLTGVSAGHSIGAMATLIEEPAAFPAFSNADALALGLLILKLARAASPKGIALSIDFDDCPLFLHFMEGTSANNVYWVNAKRNVVKRFNRSSHSVNAEYKEKGVDFNEATGLSKDDYRAEGGSVPLVVAGKGRIGTITVSGLTSAEDHALAIEGIKRYLAGERA